MIDKSLVIYASYPKTGSTYIPDIIKNINMGSSGCIKNFLFLKGKNNFIIESDGAVNYVIKTHEIMPVLLRQFKDQHSVNPHCFTDDVNGLNKDFYFNHKIIYILRNPFRVLVSAINYSRILYEREDVRLIWRRRGTDREYFIDFLGMESIPSVEDFKIYDFLRNPPSLIESVILKYIDGNGLIPVFQVPGYFDHVNYWVNFISDKKSVLVLTYEDLMKKNDISLGSLASMIGVSKDVIFKSVIDLEERRLNPKDIMYRSPFYSDFGLGTPREIIELSSWCRIRSMVRDRVSEFERYSLLD